MLAAISSTVYDPFGWIALEVMPVSAFQDRRRRTNRIATLDGGAVFNDGGYSDADRTIRLRWKVRDRDTEDSMDLLVRLYSTLNVSIDGAVFAAYVERYTPGTDESELSLLVSERLTA
jgi:hypothetical protein